MWGLFSRLLHGHEDEEDTVTPDGYAEEQQDDRPCNVSGHDYENGETKLYGYFARDRSGLRGRPKFRVYKKELDYCRKCDGVQRQETTVGHVRVTENDELEVV
jgi:hypothetical protein